MTASLSSVPRAAAAAAARSGPRDPVAADVRDRVYGGWLGKSIGGTLGLPAEGRTERLAYTFYDPIPTVAPPNDDLELQLVWLHVLERCGATVGLPDLAAAWLAHVHYEWDEYGRCRWNLRRGVPLGDVGTFENPFDAGMGSPIRSEVWAGLAAGDAGLAAAYARLDSSIDHGPEGIAGEVFNAVHQTLVLAGTPLADAVDAAIEAVDPSTETATALRLVRRLHAGGAEPWAVREAVLASHGHENFTHAPLNVALTAWALLHGGGEFERTVLLAVNAGYDTDCTAATAGATIGLMSGTAAIPPRWRAPIGDGVYVGRGILGIDVPATLDALTDRTVALMGRVAAGRGPTPAAVPPATGHVELRSLPGTVDVRPLGGGGAVPFANGELPDAVKAAGGGSFQWHAGAALGTELQVICLAPAGARLLVDGELLVDCPPGLPYVPAPHRAPGESRRRFRPARPTHDVRVELPRADPAQRVTVLLSGPDHHLVPWSGESLPHPAELQP